MKIVFILLFALVTLSAYAQTDIYIRGAGRLFPIALPQLCAQGGESSGAKDIPNTVARDLDLSGYFTVLNPASFIETPGKCGDPQTSVYSDWTVIGAEGLVRGIVQGAGGRVRVQLFLHDVNQHRVVLGKEYEGDESQIPMMAHKFANEIMKHFTGEYGPFGTQVAFSSRIGRFKELFVMDMDGTNIRQLTNDRSLAMSPAWDPSGRSLVFTSYRLRVPDLFMIDVFSRRVTQVTRREELETSPKFMPDGSSIVASQAIGRGSDLTVYSLDGKILRKLTSSAGSIDVSPSFSPDHSQIVFCSDRAGGPQIYVMSADGAGAHRVSFVSSNYCTSPVWSPKGDKLAFVCRADQGFNLFVTGIDGGNALQLTSGGNNEDPEWSPDGRYLVFSSTLGRGSIPSIALMRVDGSNIRELTRSRSGDYDPAWGPQLF